MRLAQGRLDECRDALDQIEASAEDRPSHFYRDVAPIFVQMANDRGGDDNVTCLVVYAGNDRR